MSIQWLAHATSLSLSRDETHVQSTVGTEAGRAVGVVTGQKVPRLEERTRKRRGRERGRRQREQGEGTEHHGDVEEVQRRKREGARKSTCCVTASFIPRTMIFSTHLAIQKLHSRYSNEGSIGSALTR